MIRESLGRPLATVHAEDPREQADLVVGVGLQLLHVLEVQVVTKRPEVLTTIVVVILDNLRLFLGYVARFSASTASTAALSGRMPSHQCGG